MPSNTPVGMIGLGLMGTALSARLIDAKIRVIGFDIDAERRRAFQAIGGEATGTAARLAARCRTIVVAVFNAEQVMSLLDQLAHSTGANPPLLICTTTCAPGEIADIAGRASRARLPLLEAPISGTSAEVRDGSATALIAGEPETIAAAGAILDILCPQQTRLQAIGDASRTKLAINLILQANRAALAEGLVFAESLGLDTAAFLDAARRSAAYSKVMDSKGRKMLTRDFAPQSHIAQTLKDAELILHEASRRNLPLPMTSTQAALLRAAILLEGGDADSAALIEAIRPARGPTGETR
jgi:3-hydroxyisobutyrate dehydrogenase-like beta-hydroxyacid dehydrogenase